MSDEKLRELERRWKETGAVEDEAAYLLERVRAGELTEERLELAAHCGHSASRLATQTPVVTTTDPDHLVISSLLEREGKRQVIGACLRLHRVLLETLAANCAPADHFYREFGLGPPDLQLHSRLRAHLGTWSEATRNGPVPPELRQTVERTKSEFGGLLAYEMLVATDRPHAYHRVYTQVLRLLTLLSDSGIPQSMGPRELGLALVPQLLARP